MAARALEGLQETGFHADRASQFICEVCLQSFTPAEHSDLRRTEADRLREAMHAAER